MALRQPLEHVAEVGLGIVAVELGSFGDGVDDGGALAACVAAKEQNGAMTVLPGGPPSSANLVAGTLAEGGARQREENHGGLQRIRRP